jgi:hypothetical protein
VSDEERAVDLIERAVATLPPELLAAPHAAIRRRVRRRRATGWGATAVVVLALLAAVGRSLPGPTDGGPEPAASSAGAAWVPGVLWNTVRIDPSGTRITVYAVPLLGNCADRYPSGDRVDWSDRAVTVFLVGTYTACTGSNDVATRTFELPQTIGDRLLVDGRDPTGLKHVVRAGDLPDLPAGGWSEQPPIWMGLACAALGFRYTRPGGPDLMLRAYCGHAWSGAGMPTPQRTLAVDGRTVDLDDRPGSLAAGWWSADRQLRFTLTPVDGAVGIAAFEEIVRDMTWS